MGHTIVSYTAKPGREQENAALVRAVFEELAEARPAGFRYAVFQAADSREFVHLYTDEGAAPGALQQLPAFQAFVAGAADRHEQPAMFKDFELIGAYRTFGDPERAAAAGDPATAGTAGKTRAPGPTRDPSCGRGRTSLKQRSMAEVTVRAAYEDEVHILLEMYEWLFEAPGHTPRGWDPNRARESLLEAVAGRSSTVLVGEAPGGELVGLLSAYLDLNSVRFGLRCWVEDLAVQPSRRSAGIGKLLLDAAKLWAKDRGATHLELDTGLARSDAQRFYEHQDPSAKGYSYSWAL